MKVFFDTNVALDLVMRGTEFSEAFIAYDIALTRKDTVMLSSYSVADADYILQSRGMSKIESRKALDVMTKFFECVDLIPYDLNIAMDKLEYDFEDYVIVSSAKRARADILLTRDKKFPAGVIPIMTPAEFHEKFCPKDYNYEVFDLNEFEKTEELQADEL